MAPQFGQGSKIFVSDMASPGGDVPDVRARSVNASAGNGAAATQFFSA
jgi:hypothetical protein